MSSDNRIYFQQVIHIPHNPGGTTIKPRQSSYTEADNKGIFKEALQKELGVKFSQHALQRMNSRNIKLSEADVAKLNNAVDKAAQKGAKESLVLMDNLALVVSVKNKTVITAIDGTSMKDNVFTNIDSAVII
ncbi:TIGR02530 family flagellar biosynthesis protein [Dendrosporobacter sp. 1207_IL3150]|uniref:TIGR02530 family flagellar biosynthesis protein n=1 Tax=Dendrosporobacter sp. 1207_IL3150 TaxID=3084054 RepID=UPI002FDA4D43